jgi:hypothetical protein
VDFDAMDTGGILYEVKTGYGQVARPNDPVTLNDIARRFWMQAERQVHVADSCGHKLKWYFNNPSAASVFGARNSPHLEYNSAPLPVEVWYEPFDCDLDG